MLLLAVLLTQCTGSVTSSPTPRTPRPIPTLFPTIAALQPAPKTTNNDTTDTDWRVGSHKIEMRRLHISIADRPSAPLVIVRFDPTTVRIRVGYTPAQPRMLHEWFAERQPLLVANGGYFTQEFQSTALVVSDRIASGTSYTGFGGMIAVANDGTVSLRSLRDQPYNPNEQFDQAMQSSPMLVTQGEVVTSLQDNGERARRTVIAQDHKGRILIIISPNSSFTLREMAEWLVRSNLNIDRALNLDGGSSTGLYVNAGALHEQIDSFTHLPLVLEVEAKL